jgi:hypothetical protein
VRYAAGETVQYEYGGYILVGTVTEERSRGYMIVGLKSRPIFIHDNHILGRWK